MVVFESLIQSMRDTAWGLVALASSVVGLALVSPLGAQLQPATAVSCQAYPPGSSPASGLKQLALQAGQVGTSGVPDIVVKGITVSRYTHTINALLVAALFWMGAISFRKVPAVPDWVPCQAQLRLVAHARAMQAVHGQRSSGVFMCAGAQCKG